MKKWHAWSAILTARFVLPVWQNYMPDDNLAERILEVTEGLLLEKITLADTSEEMEVFYNATGNADDFVEDGKARAALIAAYSALNTAVGYIPFKEISPRQIEEGFPDEIIFDWRADAASSAVLAYSGAAYNLDTLPNFFYQGGTEIMVTLRNTTNPTFDPKRRKEFWEWWLNTAIFQAWKLAQKA